MTGARRVGVVGADSFTPTKEWVGNAPSAPAAVAVRPARHGRLLLVRHGKGRGPWIEHAWIRPPYMQPFLDDLSRRDPKLRRRIDVWETSTPQPDLADVKAVVFLLQDPLRERFSDCFAEGQELAERARSTGIRVVNPPEALSHSIKSIQSRLWQEHGIPTPANIPFSSLDEMRAAAERATFPAFVRADWLHVQEMRLVRTRDELLQLELQQIPLPGCLVPFIDTRQGFRERQPNSEFARYFHKKRVWVIGDRVQRAHVFLGSSPIVGATQCTFAHYSSWNPLRRLRGRLRCRKHVALDNEFFQASEPNAHLFVRASRALNLEFVAIDYSSFADGRVVLWEANPYFALEQWPLPLLGRQRRVKERHRACYRAIHAFVVSLLDRES